MNKPTTVSIDADTIRDLDSRRLDGETRSARLARDLRDYRSLLEAGFRRARTVLSPAEAMVVLDVQNGAHPAPLGHWLGDRLLNQVRDGITLDGLDIKHGVDGPALLGKLGSIGDMATVALVDWAAIVWSLPGDIDPSEAVAIFKGQ